MPKQSRAATDLEGLLKALHDAYEHEQDLSTQLAELRAQQRTLAGQLADALRTQLGTDLAAAVAATLAPPLPTPAPTPPAPTPPTPTPGGVHDLSPTIPAAPAAPAIRFDYDKAQAHPIRTDTHGKPIWYGYSLRPSGADGNPVPLTGIVIHSTEGPKGEGWEPSLAYIRDSPDVSAHYYVGRTGEIQRILDPGPYRAWHAGVSSFKGLSDWNNFAVGIELHHTKGDAPYTEAQLAALRWLCGQLIADHPTIVKEHIALHRWVAVDASGHTGRKIDPTDLDDAFWQQWIADL